MGELSDPFQQNFKSKSLRGGTECESDSVRCRRSAHHTHAFHKRMHYSEFPKSLIGLRSNDSSACKLSQHVVRDASRICGSSSFPSLLLFLQERSPPLPPPHPHSSPLQVPLGLICIISPKSAARYDGITLHDGWIWAKAAVRTGYLANVLSRPRPGTREEGRPRVGGREREGGGEGKGKRRRISETQ